MGRGCWAELEPFVSNASCANGLQQAAWHTCSACKQLANPEASGALPVCKQTTNLARSQPAALAWIKAACFVRQVGHPVLGNVHLQGAVLPQHHLQSCPRLSGHVQASQPAGTRLHHHDAHAQEDSVEQQAAPQQHHQPQEIFSPAASASVPGAQQLQSSSPPAAVPPRLASFPMLVGRLPASSLMSM